MQQLDNAHYGRVASLLVPQAAYNVSISGLLDGSNPGEIYVDDVDHPTSALVYSVEGFHLVGDAENEAFIADVNAYLNTSFFSQDASWRVFYTQAATETWVAQLPAIFHPRKVFSDARQHYICTVLAHDWREVLPEGFAVRRIDDALLDDAKIRVPEHIFGWINHNWGTREHYAEHGFGFCVVHGAEVVSWSLADCVSSTRCEIGIQTQEIYRRQGLAAIAAAAAVEYALSSGFDEVGWHCDADNIGSWKTALKVGFVKERDYRAHYCTFGDMA